MAAPPKPPTKPRGTKRKTPSTTTTATTTTCKPTLTPLIPTIQTAITSTHNFLQTNDLHLLPSQLLSLESSLSKIQSFIPPTLTTLTPPPQPQPPPCWFERFVLSSISDEDPRWSHFFRMSKPTFSLLHSKLSHDVPLSHFALGCALYKLAHGGPFSFVGRRFGLGPHEACRAFYAVIKLICGTLGGFVCEFGSDMGEVLMGFDQINLPNCCGVLGFEKFSVEGGELLGKDGFLVVQALVDGEGRFLDVSAGWPSCTFSPSSILEQTRLFLGVEESKELLNGPEIELFEGNLMPQYVLGDCCYPCLPWLVTPFVREGLSESEIGFNEVHRRAMRFVKMAFGRVRANWQLLNRRWKEEFVEFLPFIITAACVLNNFLLKNGEMLPDVDVDVEVESVVPQGMAVCNGVVDEGAERNRSLLALHLSRLS